ncbi:MAG: 23S rRNA (adenine(2503)-C(2))-methyltransferase RlmN [Kiritimatiellia bacterium]
MNILALTCDELADEMKRRHGKGLHHAAAVCREVFRNGAVSFEKAPEFARSKPLAAKVAEALYFPACQIEKREEAEGVLKFATRLDDGERIESVIISARGRTTLCVSSQAGCRMGCAFCATAKMGYRRNLRTEEIVWQVHAARFQLGRTIDNVVFMGMGEPLDNLDQVIQAIRVMGDARGLNIPFRRITVSTAGLVDGIRRLGGEKLPNLRLAVSVNAAEDDLRTRLMPINHRHPLKQLKDELQAFPRAKNGIVFLEYVLLGGVNDSREQARQFARWTDGLPVRVNVIAYNGGPDPAFMTPPPEQVRRFCSWLAEEKLFVRARESKGHALLAACGQLGGDKKALIW